MLKRVSKLMLILFIASIEIVFAETGTFMELQTLINDNVNGEIILEKDYKNYGSESQITINKDLILDLNGHVINADFKSNIFYVTDGFTLTIEDSNKTAVHKFDVDQFSLATLNEVDGSLTIYGGCITGGNYLARNSVGAAIHLNNGTLILNSGNIVGNKIYGKYQFGAGIGAENNSKITINGGMVSYNSAAWECYGGGIYLNNSDLTINGGTISYNYGNYGGGINVYDNSNLVVNDGFISNNIAGHNGGGIALMVLDSKVSQGVVSKAIINGGIIENNTVLKTTWVGVGGGISTCKGAELTINGGIIKKNTAARGGGVGAWNGGTINIYGGTISENIASEDTTVPSGSIVSHGAGIYFNAFYTTGYGSIAANLVVGGSAVITGNVNDVTKKEDNLYFANGQKISLGTGDNAPTKDMNIKITMENPDTFAINLTDDVSKYFAPDDTYYEIGYSSNGLKLVHDIEDPTGKISIKENNFLSLLNTITFGLFFNDNIEVNITANDDNDIKKIEYIIADNEKTLQDLKNQTNWINYISSFNIDKENKYIIYAKITDSVDKVTYISSNGFIIDKTTPKIVGINTNNGVYYTTQKFTVEDEYVDKVLIDGIEVNDYILLGNIDKIYEIDVYDKSGNSTYFSIRMMPISTITNVIDNININNVKSSDKDVILNVKDKVDIIDKTYATLKEKEDLQKIIDNCNILLNIINETLDKLELTNQAVNLYLNKELTNEDKINIQKELDDAYKVTKDNLTIDENISHKKNIQILEDILKNKKVYTYEIINGKNEEFNESKVSSYIITIDGNYKLFESLNIDNLVLEKDIDYVVTEGSTIITFTDLGLNKLNNLNVGTYDVKIKFTNKELISKLIINELVMEDNPKTNDNIVNYILMATISLISILTYGLYITKKSNN